MLDPRTPLATLVLDHSECAAVFARHRIDCCADGQRPLVDACRDAGVDAVRILAELETAIARRAPKTVDANPSTLGTRDVIVRLIAPHHQYLHRTLPFLQALATKVAGTHGGREPALFEVARQVGDLVELLRAHLAEEEHVLFPALIAGHREDAAPMLDEMRTEHEQMDQMFAALRLAAADYRPPPWACTSYRALMSELAALEADTAVHLAVENDVLMPRFVG